MDKVLIEIRGLEAQEDTDELGGYLIQLAKWGEEPLKYENEFRKHLYSADWYMRKVAVFCLLFALKIDKPEYRDKALEFVKDKAEDFEVRIWSASGLAQTYSNTKDKNLLSIYMMLIDDSKEDEVVKTSTLSSALQVYGLSSREQAFRSSSSLPDFSEMVQVFEKEIIQIKRLIKR